MATLPKPFHLLQIGANDGVYPDPLHDSLLAIDAIYATRVDPVPYYYDLLCANINSYALSQRVRCLQFAVASKNGFVDIVFPDPSKALGTELKGYGRLLGITHDDIVD